MLKFSLNPELLRVDSFSIQYDAIVCPTEPDPVTTTIPSSETWSDCFTNGTDEC